MPFIYLAGIMLFLIIGMVIYFVADRREKKRMKMLKIEEIDSFSLQQLKTEPTQQPYELRAASPAIEKPIIVDPQFESFQMELDEPAPVVSNEDYDDDLEAKFAEYQKFLRENLEMEENDEEEIELSKHGFRRTLGDEYEEDGLDENDYRRFRETSTNNQLNELMEGLSPQAREIFMSDILARKEFEDATPETFDEVVENPDDNAEN